MTFVHPSSGTFRRPTSDTVDPTGEQDARLAFESFGVRIGVTVHDTALLEAIPAHLPPGWRSIAYEDLDCNIRLERTAADPERRLPVGACLIMNGERLNWAPSAELLLDALESRIQICVAEFATPDLFVHAGVVRWRGATIMLPGKSYAGKSTLVMALVDAGAVYYSDEYAVLDVRGWTAPYRRRISLRDGPLGPARRLDLGDDSPGTPDPPAAPVDLVLFCTFSEGADWACHALGHGETMMALFEHTVAIQRRPADAFAVLGAVAEKASGHRGIRGDLASAIGWLDEQVDLLRPQP